MRLSYLVKETAPVWERTLVPGSWPGDDPKVFSVHCRAADVLPGGLFIAIKGFTADGHDYVDEAVERGAVAVVAQKRVATPARLVVVRDTRKAMASIAARFYNNPSRELVVTGISGTNGKTTTVWILETILAGAGLKTGVIGTVNLRYDGKIFDNSVTTPESLDLQKILFDMKNSGVTHVIMEVSSHGIDLKRINHCAFDGAVFTNLSQDHLDYHKTMKQYFNCKKRFFTRLVPEGGKKAAAVINVDDEKGAEIARALSYDTYRVTTGRDGEISCHDPVTDLSGVRGTLCIGDGSVSFASHLIGRFNLENILCAAGAAHVLGISLEAIQQGIQGCSKVPGRLEKIDNSGSRHIFVDYAHTPDALESVLKTLKSTSKARLILVFGCGGDRDKAKRPMMGRIAAENSDLAIVTSDNPRSEDPLAIIEDILQGIEGYTPRDRKWIMDNGELITADG
ncbi:MAG: UDP-N-acetylmuramoyl-L-alanyl-D-glutamate--2,6-diaminopimelate ligase, partial [Desulfobacteraceae bacterium]